MDIVVGKTGEEQVKEALDRAEKESEEAARENHKSATAKLRQETAEFLSSNELDNSKKLTRSSSTDLKSALDKKVEELAKYHDRHLEHSRLSNELLDKNLPHSANVEETQDSVTATADEDSDKKMVEMAKKLNNLVLKFQRKMGRLSSNPEYIFLFQVNNKNTRKRCKICSNSTAKAPKRRQ